MLEFVEFLKDENTIKINGIWDKNIIEMAWENFIFEPKTKSLTLKADNFSHKNFLNFFSKIRRNLGENKDQNFRINSKEIIFDFSNLKQIDTAGICFFFGFAK